ncbi:MAG: hypothetical protein MI741_05425 [Rhodospirillales bacterium]|nr:hypothetical protein [Rhodospirillales bacterium]
MIQNNTMALAKQKIAEKVGVSVTSLEFSFIWTFAENTYFSFQIKEPGNAHNGSTLSVNVTELK